MQDELLLQMILYIQYHGYFFYLSALFQIPQKYSHQLIHLLLHHLNDHLSTNRLSLFQPFSRAFHSPTMKTVGIDPFSMHIFTYFDPFSKTFQAIFDPFSIKTVLVGTCQEK